MVKFSRLSVEFLDNPLIDRTILCWAIVILLAPFRFWLQGRVKLIEPLMYEDHELVWIVPADKVSDLASLPMIFAPFFPSRLRTAKAGVLHDDMYMRAKTWGERHIANRVFYRALRYCGVDRFRSFLMWLGTEIAIPFIPLAK
jgi:hypothetical protein